MSLQRRAVTIERDTFSLGNMVSLIPWKMSFPMIYNMFRPFFATILSQSHANGEFCCTWQKLKRDSNTGVSLWILQNILRLLFLQSTSLLLLLHLNGAFAQKHYTLFFISNVFCQLSLNVAEAATKSVL